LLRNSYGFIFKGFRFFRRSPKGFSAFLGRGLDSLAVCGLFMMETLLKIRGVIYKTLQILKVITLSSEKRHLNGFKFIYF